MSGPPYLADIHATLPRVLSLFDSNPISATRGVGDRYRWAWRGHDFANGTFQGAAHGLACLVAHGLLPSGLAPESIVGRIHEIFDGTRHIMRANGSLDEILPLESSYCVTALVAFDLLCALELLGSRLDAATRSRHLETIRPLIRHLRGTRESHGIISNHLAVAAAAFARWQQATGEDFSGPIKEILSVIVAHSSPEGWFKEYDGADPGYQTLALDYLVDLDRTAPSHGLRSKLERSVWFLCHFAHPDGSFGGLYGSRNTRFLYPAGIEELALGSPDAAALARFARDSHGHKTVVGLAAMDDSNLIPMFNSFCRAAVLARREHAPPTELPFEKPGGFQTIFPSAGLITTRTDVGYGIVNFKKGGAFHWFSGSSVMIDGGPRAVDARGRWFTAQTLTESSKLVSATPELIIIEAPLTKFHLRSPSPLDFVILRLMCLTWMRLPWINALIKRALVRLLVRPHRDSANICRRSISLTSPPELTDTWRKRSSRLELVARPQPFHAIHMASQGYWQRGDDH